MSEQLSDGTVAILALVQETESDTLSTDLEQYQHTIEGWDAAEVAEEVQRAKDLEAQMAYEAKQKLREEKKAELKQVMEERRAKIKADFDELKNKFRK